MAAEMIGSVGVRQAAITREEIKLMGGKTTKTIAMSVDARECKWCTELTHTRTRDD